MENFKTIVVELILSFFLQNCLRPEHVQFVLVVKDGVVGLACCQLSDASFDLFAVQRTDLGRPVDLQSRLEKSVL